MMERAPGIISWGLHPRFTRVAWVPGEAVHQAVSDSLKGYFLGLVEWLRGGNAHKIEAKLGG